jgi:dGTPase
MEWNELLNCTRIRDLDKRTRPSNETDRQTDEAGRTEYDRDYDRLVFSTPFKRLQDKAQVFPLEEHDGVRTRLTHSLEVASVARGLTHAVVLKLPESAVSPEQARAMETIAAACALAHDLGNPHLVMRAREP